MQISRRMATVRLRQVSNVGEEWQPDHGRALRRFMSEDRHEAVEVGDLNWETKCQVKSARPQEL